MWRNTVLRAELMPGVDGRVAIMLSLFAMHWAWWTFGLFAGACGFFWLIGRRGHSMSSMGMRIRRSVVGNFRPAWPAAEFGTARLPDDMPAM